MKDCFGHILYIGKAKDLKRRVTSYFQPSRRLTLQQPKIAALIPLITDIETLTVSCEAEAILLEGKLLKKWKPKYNTDFVDDKRFFLIRVDLHRAMPRFCLTRLRNHLQARYFGPFAYSGLLRKTLLEMRRRFGIVLGDATPKCLSDDRYRLYDDARAEIYGHPNEVTRSQYRNRVEQACAFLEGKTKQWLETLHSQMQTAAEHQDYEHAAELRDRIKALEHTTAKIRTFQKTDPSTPQPPQAILKQLREQLALPRLPKCIECFDISHISGTFVVASMVQFLNGLPKTNLYRRYRIKGPIQNDDFRAMEEVVKRRYQRLDQEKKPFPDLIVIDGGKGQVAAALRAFVLLDLAPPPLIGLAKKYERIIFSDARKPLQLLLHHPALQLLQRVRDEAHRFANTYNATLRSRQIRESLLDELPGLGQKRKVALLRHFKNIHSIRKATVEALTEVEGIGPKTAHGIITFLGSR